MYGSTLNVTLQVAIMPCAAITFTSSLLRIQKHQNEICILWHHMSLNNFPNVLLYGDLVILSKLTASSLIFVCLVRLFNLFNNFLVWFNTFYVATELAFVATELALVATASLV